jgi:hypothetical protein
MLKARVEAGAFEAIAKAFEAKARALWTEPGTAWRCGAGSTKNNLLALIAPLH